MSAFKVDPDALYLGDNGCCLCGEHLGETAKQTGRDLSGQPVFKLTAHTAAAMGARRGGISLCCEKAGCWKTLTEGDQV